MMKKNNLIFKIIILFILVLVFSITIVSSSYAWFVGVKRTGNLRFRYGDVCYEFVDYDTSLKPSNALIKPGDNLINNGKYIQLINKSTVSSQIRVKVIANLDGTEYLLTNNVNDLIYLNLMTSTLEGNTISRWDLNLDDNYFYYIYDCNSNSSILPSSISQNARNDLPFIDQLILNGNLIGNLYDAKSLTISMIFEAKQSNNVEWADLGEADFRII